MIFKKQKKIFDKEIKEIIKKVKHKKIFIDFTYGLGGISKVIRKNISKRSLLISYDINKLIKVRSYKNFIFNNECYTNFTRLKLVSGIDFSIIDIGYTDNETMNNYFEYPKYDNFINMSTTFFLKKMLGHNFIDFNKFRRKIVLEKGLFSFKYFVLYYKKRNKNIITSSIRNYVYDFKNKIVCLLEYILLVLKKKSYLLIICFNSYESKIVDKFYKKNSIYFNYKKISKRFNKCSIAVMKVFYRNDNNIRI
ncbi:hypothetical protein ACWNX6_00685 [Candidatus Vidania fulgoroideorum]